MQMQKTEFFFVTRRGVAEAVDENPQLLLSLDYRVPDRIVAFISPRIHNEVTRQIAKNPDLDGVCMRASLSSMIADACEYLEDDRAIDRWVKALEEAIGHLQNYRRERQTALKASCESCTHPASEHYRPHLGDISCHRRGCGCAEFAPLERLLPKKAPDSQESPNSPRPGRFSLAPRA